MELAKLCLKLSILTLTLSSCGGSEPKKQLDEVQAKGQPYHSKELGWTMEIPNGWKIISQENIEAFTETGKDAVEKTLESDVDTKALKHLCSFQKDQFNIFSSTCEPFKEEAPGDYQRNNRAINELIFKTFADQGIKADSASGKEIIGGLEFNVFYATIYSKENQVILNQIYYSRFQNGFDFGAILSYNNAGDKETLMAAWKNSKFEK